MRNHIAHGYFDIDGDMVLDVVKNDLDDLLTAVEYFVDKFQVEDQ
ncbi:HepT-like ribonuclease domain-containing protein [Hallella sp.]